MSLHLVIAGGGIGGLAAALGACLAGWEPRVLEQAETFSEFGAGIQLGPNTTSILRGWGLLDDELVELVARPSRLRVRDSLDGRELAAMELAGAFEQRYGAPYLTVHRADLQHALLRAAQARPALLQTGRRVTEVRQHDDAVTLQLSSGASVECDALVGADGLWSRVREQVIAADAPPHPTGHLAWRALLRQADLPQALRSNEVTVWLGPRMHLVSYPVRAGEWLNVVCLAEGPLPRDARGWEQEGAAADVQAVVASACPALRELVGLVPQWGLWVLHGRAPVHGPGAMAAGRIALLGDAAHPMLPYLAQGAGMALEDAREMQRVLTAVADRAIDVPTALRRYALNRWERCARVQRRSRRNATIFHATGPLRWGRNLSLALLGDSLLDLPWLYGATSE